MSSHCTLYSCHSIKIVSFRLRCRPALLGYFCDRFTTYDFVLVSIRWPERMRNPATFLPYFVRTANQNKEKLKDYLQENDYIVFTIKNSYRVCTFVLRKSIMIVKLSDASSNSINFKYYFCDDNFSMHNAYYALKIETFIKCINKAPTKNLNLCSGSIFFSQQ